VGKTNSGGVMKGAYLLFLHVKHDVRVRVGASKVLNLRKGYYVYVGSALNSLEDRLARHFRRRKNRRWHVDYLTSSCNVSVEFAVIIPSGRRLECVLSRRLSRCASPVPGFGNSDCKVCPSHLYRVPT